MSDEKNNPPKEIWKNAVSDSREPAEEAAPMNPPTDGNPSERFKRAMQNLGELAKNWNETSADGEEAAQTTPVQAAESPAPMAASAPKAPAAPAVAAQPAPAQQASALNNTTAHAAETERVTSMDEKNTTPQPAQQQPVQQQPVQQQPVQQPLMQQPMPMPMQPQMPYGMPPYGAYPAPYGGYPMYPQMMPMGMPMGMPMAPQMPPAAPQSDERSTYEKQASMRVVYQDGDPNAAAPAAPPQQLPYGAYPAAPYYPQYPTMMPQMYPGAAYPQTEPAVEEKKPEDDYLAGMQVLFESDPSELPTVEEEEELYIDTSSIKDLYEDLAHTAKPLESQDGDVISASLSDLFIEAQEEQAHRRGAASRALGAVLPWSGDSSAEIIRKLVLLVSIIAIVVSGSVIGYSYLLEPLSTVEKHKGYEALISLRDNSDWDAIYKANPKVTFPAKMQAKYAEAYLRNNDFSGWISIPAFGINLPIMQREDKPEAKTEEERDGNRYYLRRGMDGESTRRGMPYFEKTNSLQILSRNTTVFGHNLRQDDLIFGGLEQYTTVEGFKKAPLIECNTIYNDYKWKVYAVFYSNGLRRTANEYLLNYIFSEVSTNKVFEEYIEEMNRRRLYDTGVDILDTDKILTLSTCAYNFTESRLVVVARLVRPGEDERVDTSKAKMAVNPQYPQVYYDKIGQKNPYTSFETWVPQ